MYQSVASAPIRRSRRSRRSPVVVVAALGLALGVGGCTDPGPDGALGGSTRPSSTTTPTSDADQADGVDVAAVRERRVTDFGDVPEVSTPEFPEPDEVLTSTPDELVLAIEEAIESPEVAILDVAGIVDDGPTPAEVAGFGDGNRRSGSGELVVLDQQASLACANVELALFALDDGDRDQAEVQVARAADRAATSDLTPVRAWAEPLARTTRPDGSIDPLALVGFLSLCVEGGHEL